MVRMATRREACEGWEDNDVCPNIKKRVHVLIKDARPCKAFNSGCGFYEIKDGKSTLPVSINDRTCACNAWQITGIPCKHGIKAILHSSQDPLSFCSEWYSCWKYKKAYGSSIKAIPDTEQWPDINQPVIAPPQMKRGIGRPSKNRKRDADEDRKGKRSTTVRCGKCNCFGHNAKTCMGGLTKKAKKAHNEASTSAAAPSSSSQPPLIRSQKAPTRSQISSSQPPLTIHRTICTRSVSVSQPQPTAAKPNNGKKKNRRS